MLRSYFHQSNVFLLYHIMLNAFPVKQTYYYTTLYCMVSPNKQTYYFTPLDWELFAINKRIIIHAPRYAAHFLPSNKRIIIIPRYAAYFLPSNKRIITSHYTAWFLL